ncbi:MAG: hypothetical protein F6J95_015840 [Leptolyngbya sp. SIO1E4]|nr:hypothetical protein [Leptolyngbya sp. SIO1E4]
MANRLSLISSNSFRPADHETLFCKSLVVGNTVAAYTATLAILQAGGQVCWVQPGKLDITDYLNQEQPLTLTALRSRFSWRLGRSVSPWETAVILSRSQQRFWANWQAQPLLPKPSSKDAAADSERSQRVSKGVQLQQAIAPYLSSRQLMFIPQGEPVRVLYAETHGQRRVYQVVFRDRGTGQGFQVHAKLTLDATRDATLQQLLTDSPGNFPQTEFTLKAEHLASAQSGSARGTFFEDAIALTLAQSPSGRARSRPVSIPLRALIPQNTEGFLCVSQPGCEPALRPLFQQPLVRWTLGEAVGHVAARIVGVNHALQKLMTQPHWRWQLQQQLVQRGIPLFAFDDVGLEDPDFEAIQMGAIADVVRTMRQRDLRFRPETPVTRSVVASALIRLPQNRDPAATSDPAIQDVSPNHWAFTAIQQAIALDVMTTTPRDYFCPGKVLSKRELWEVLRPLYPPDVVLPPWPQDETPARRRHLSRGLYPILQSRLGLQNQAKTL